MADKSAQNIGESSSDQIQALVQNLPALMQAVNSQVVPSAQAQLAGQQATSGEYDKLMADLYKTYAPQLAQTGAEVDKISRGGAADTSAGILANQGKDIGAAVTGIDKAANPEYYKTRATTSGKLDELLNSINLNNSTPEAERLVNQENARSGNLNNTNSTNTVANALDFGNEKAKRTATLSSAISSATNFLTPASNPSAVNAATQASGTPAANTGVSQFAGVQAPNTAAGSTGNSLLDQIGSAQANAANINANRRDILDRVNQTTSSV